MNIRRLCLCGITLFFAAFAYADEPHPGKVVYDKYCAACHDHPEESRSRSFETLTRMIPALIQYALTDGKMQAQAAAMSPAELEDLMNFFSGQTRNDNNWTDGGMCAAADRSVDLSKPATIATFGLGHKNHRYLDAASAGLTRVDMPRLELAWAFAFPNITMMRSQPAIVGNTMFITPVDSRQLYALNLDGTPCVKWIYESEVPLRSAITYGQIGARGALVFGDSSARVHAVDAASGERLWVRELALFAESIITGTPQLAGDRVYASISQFEIMIGHNEEHTCCTSHGGVAALDAATGEVIWLTPTLPDAKPVRDRGDGQMIWGPSGAPVWTSPAIDTKRGVLYVGTGEATSEPAHPHTDAILALDLETGAVRWSFQATENDIFLAACRRENRSLNCPPETSVERDVDFGASVIIARRSDGRDILLAGQKSSDVWALDPDADGKLIWHWNGGRGTANGGIHWGMAFNGSHVFAGISDPGRPRPGFQPRPGLYALDVDTGQLAWEHRVTADCSGREALAPYCRFLHGFSGATLAIGDTVAQGSLDGWLHIFDAASGEVLFSYDTLREFEGINGISGRGGAIDNASIVAADGTLYVSSGYGMFGQPPGNVLLAFKPTRGAAAN